MRIPIIGGGVTIWEKVLFKLRVYFYGMVSMKEVFQEYSHRINTNLDVVVEFLEVHSSAAFELYLDEEFIGFW